MWTNVSNALTRQETNSKSARLKYNSSKGCRKPTGDRKYSGFTRQMRLMVSWPCSISARSSSIRAPRSAICSPAIARNPSDGWRIHAYRSHSPFPRHSSTKDHSSRFASRPPLLTGPSACSAWFTHPASRTTHRVNGFRFNGPALLEEPPIVIINTASVTFLHFLPPCLPD